MHELMQDWPLRVSRIIDHAARYHGARPVRGRSAESPLVATTYAAVRTGRCASPSGSPATGSAAATSWASWPGTPRG